MIRRLLLVPSVAKGNGSGHIVRAISLARALGDGAAVYLPDEKTGLCWSAAELSLSYSRELAGIEVLSEEGELQARRWDLVVLDRRSTAREELLRWEALGPVLALDEGGEARGSAHYLVDILPRLPSKREGPRPFRLRGLDRARGRGDEANKTCLGFLDLPERRRARNVAFDKILVCFGGEDRAGLGIGLARRIIAEGLASPESLTLVSGALNRGAPPLGLEGVAVLGPVQDLKERLAGFDLVLTLFGLTAFEAAWAGCGVILLNPSAYHRELSRTAGFPEIGVLEPDLDALRAFLRSPGEVLARCAAAIPRERSSLADFISSLDPAGPRDCPVCASRDRASLNRGEGRSFFRCRSCGCVYMTRFAGGRASPYKKSYFFEEYRKQYGRTYLEDWPNLVALSAPRLDRIQKLAERSLGSGKGLSLLDVGCAYGPFLASARERGLEPYGLDAAVEAVEYVRVELGLPAISGDFLDPATASAFGGPFDVVTMWYVIEHFDDLDRALRNSASLLRPGGILALSTPSGEGAQARFDRQGFFERSPNDHFTIWEPSRAAGILKDYGFRVKRIVVTGHHPERLPLIRKAFAAPPPRMVGALGALVSRLFSLGDTFEIYALRETSRSAVLETVPPAFGGEGAEPGAWREHEAADRRDGPMADDKP